MSTPPDMADRHARVLARLTEMGLALAEQTFEDAQAAETAEQRIERVKAFHTVSRSVRQTVALEARLARQRDSDTREAAWTAALSPPPRPNPAEMRERVSAVRDGVMRVVWRELEDDDSVRGLAQALEEGLEEDALHDNFWAETLDERIVRMCVDMGFPEDLARGWRDLPDPPEPPDLEADEEDEAEAVGETFPPPEPGGPEPQPQSSA